MAKKLTEIIRDLGISVADTQFITGFTGGRSLVSGVLTTNVGSGFDGSEVFSFTGGTPSTPAEATVLITGNQIDGNPVVTNRGDGYLSIPTFGWVGGTGIDATFVVAMGALDVDAIPTITKEVGTIIRLAVGGTLFFYQLTDGILATSSPAIIRPTDFAVTTNEKYWLLVSPFGLTTDSLVAITADTSATTLDLSLSKGFEVTVETDTTIDFSNVAIGRAYVLAIKMDSLGEHRVGFDSDVEIIGGQTEFDTNPDAVTIFYLTPLTATRIRIYADPQPTVSSHYALTVSRPSVEGVSVSDALNVRTDSQIGLGSYTEDFSIRIVFRNLDGVIDGSIMGFGTDAVDLETPTGVEVMISSGFLVMRFYGTPDSEFAVISTPDLSIGDYGDEWISLVMGRRVNSPDGFCIINGVEQRVTSVGGGGSFTNPTWADAVTLDDAIVGGRLMDVHSSQIFNFALPVETCKVLDKHQLPSQLKSPSETLAYASDFTAGVDGWSAIGVNTIVVGNIDGIGGENDVLQFSTTGSATESRISSGTVFTSPVIPGGHYREITVDVFIPSSNARINGASIAGVSGDNKRTVSLDSWVTIKGILSVVSSVFQIHFEEGGDVSPPVALPSGELGYIRNVRIRTVGVIWNPDYSNPSGNLYSDRSVSEAGARADSGAEKLVTSNPVIDDVSSVAFASVMSVDFTDTGMKLWSPADQDYEIELSNLTPGAEVIIHGTTDSTGRAVTLDASFTWIPIGGAVTVNTADKAWIMSILCMSDTTVRYNYSEQP